MNYGDIPFAADSRLPLSCPSCYRGILPWCFGLAETAPSSYLFTATTGRAAVYVHGAALARVRLHLFALERQCTERRDDYFKSIVGAIGLFRSAFLCRQESLRLQLAAAHLPTLEEMLLPVSQTEAGADHGPCFHCQQQKTHRQGQQSQDGQQQPSAFASEGEDPSETRAKSNKSASPAEASLNGDSSIESSSSNRLNSEPAQGESERNRATDAMEGSSSSFTRQNSNRDRYAGAALCRSVVHLPLVLQLLSPKYRENEVSLCSCRVGDECSSSVATPSTLRLMIVEASAMLLRDRAEYGCFLPFLFQQQLHANQPLKLRGLQRWEEQEEWQKQQQQHVQALLEMRQSQIDDTVPTVARAQLQKQLNDLRQQLQTMQQQLLQLQQQKFLQKLLEGAEGTLCPPAYRKSTVLHGSSTQSDEMEEALPHVAQLGLVFILMVGVVALLFTTVERSSH